MASFFWRNKKKKKEDRFTPKLGNIFEDWTLQRDLGDGSYGVVKLYKKEDNYVAIKKFDSSKEGESEFKSELSGFIKAYKKRGDHRNVVGFVAAYKERAGSRIALEYCKEGSLSDIWEKFPDYTEKDVREIIRQIAAGLQFMRDGGVVHRDIKPDNILVRSYDPIDVAIADLNFAKSAKTAKHMTVFTSELGTNGYKAPEVTNKDLRKKSKNSYNHKCDVWSLGIIAFELLSGAHKPFSPTLEDIENLKSDARYLNQCQFSYLLKMIASQYSSNSSNVKLEFEPAKNWERVSEEGKRMVARMLEMKYEERIDYPEIIGDQWMDLEMDIWPNLFSAEENERYVDLALAGTEDFTDQQNKFGFTLA